MARAFSGTAEPYFHRGSLPQPHSPDRRPGDAHRLHDLDLQATYFVIESFRELFHLTEQRGFEPIYESWRPPSNTQDAAARTDHIYHTRHAGIRVAGWRGSAPEPI